MARTPRSFGQPRGTEGASGSSRDRASRTSRSDRDESAPPPLTEADFSPDQLRDRKSKAVQRAVRLLALRDRSQADIRERLERASFLPSEIEHAIARMRAIGALDDERHARSVVRRATREVPAGDILIKDALTRSKAQAKHAAKLIAELPGESARAMQAAETLAKRLPAKADATTRWRRLLAAMGRRGFDGEASRTAVEAVLGSLPEPRYESNKHEDEDASLSDSKQRAKADRPKKKSKGLSRKTPLKRGNGLNRTSTLKQGKGLKQGNVFSRSSTLKQSGFKKGTGFKRKNVDDSPGE